MMARLETMILMGIELPLPAIRRQLSSGIDIIVHLGRLRDKSRKVLEISEVNGIKDGEVNLRPLFKFIETGMESGRIVGELRKVNNLINTEKWLKGGMSIDWDTV